MQIAFSHDPLWFVVGAVQHGISCSTGLAALPLAILKKNNELALWKVSKQKNENDKQQIIGVVVCCSLYSVSLKEQNRCSSRHDMCQLLMQKFRFLSSIRPYKPCHKMVQVWKLLVQLFKTLYLVQWTEPASKEFPRVRLKIHYIIHVHYTLYTFMKAFAFVTLVNRHLFPGKPSSNNKWRATLVEALWCCFE